MDTGSSGSVMPGRESSLATGDRDVAGVAGRPARPVTDPAAGAAATAAATPEERTLGDIAGAGFLSHVPTIMLPEKTRRALNEGHEISLVPGLERLRREVLDEIRPDTFVVFDTHWFTTVEFVVTAHARRAGHYTSEELPRVIRRLPYDLAGDPALTRRIAAKVGERTAVRCTANDDDCLPIHYPTVNLAHYLDRGERWISVSICQTARDDDFLAVGAALGQAVGESDARVVLLASGGMSHRFWPLSEFERHEASDPVHVRTPEARAADEQRLAWWAQGDHAAVIDSMDDYRPHKPEGMFGHYLMMVSALGGRDCIAAGRRFSAYENAAGTGQVHIWFDRPAEGWSHAGNSITSTTGEEQ